jgi:hypothetical protein
MANRGLVSVVLLVLSTGCMGPQSPTMKMQEVARETNLAARFGRMDMALEHAAEGTREHFIKRRAAWGGAIRVFEADLSGLNMADSEHATVLVDFQWMRVDENTLHTTRIEQSWRNGEKDRGWVITRERRISGDPGLFGDSIARNDAPEPRGDVQFPTKTIRATE